MALRVFIKYAASPSAGVSQQPQGMAKSPSKRSDNDLSEAARQVSMPAILNNFRVFDSEVKYYAKKKSTVTET